MGFVKTAIRGAQGEHRYFTSAFAWGELDQMAVLPEDLPDLDPDRQMQRMLAKKRIAELSEYLTRTSNHFFSALTFIILPRDLEQWAEEGRDFCFSPEEDAATGLGDVGVLELSGRVRLLPADGQHRLRGAMEAMKRRPSLADETVPVVLLPYKGTDQVRQLFADLNLNAKPVNKTVGYAYDSRDPSVQLAKHVASSVPLFEDRVNLRSNSLPRSSANVITLNVLVEGTRTLLAALEKRGLINGDLRRAGKRTELAIIEGWEHVIRPFEDVGEGSGWIQVLDGESTAAGSLRDRFVFPHGVGWKALTKAAGALIQEHGEADWPHVFESAVGRIDWQRTSPSWQGVAMSNGRVNNTDTSVDAVAKLILRVAAGDLDGDATPGDAGTT